MEAVDHSLHGFRHLRFRRKWPGARGGSHGHLRHESRLTGGKGNRYARETLPSARYVLRRALLDFTSVFDSDGSAIIIHAKPDTSGAEASAGDRVACGVTEQTEPRAVLLATNGQFCCPPLGRSHWPLTPWIRVPTSRYKLCHRNAL